MNTLEDFDDSNTNLCFISYRSAGILRPKLYLVKIRRGDREEAAKGELFVDFIWKHPGDGKKKDNVVRYWPD